MIVLRRRGLCVQPPAPRELEPKREPPRKRVRDDERPVSVRAEVEGEFRAHRALVVREERR